MNILILANKALNPPDGGSLAILSLAKGYSKMGHHVFLLNMITHKHTNDNDFAGSEYKNSLKILGVNVNTKTSLIAILTNLLFSNKPYIAQRFISKAYQKKLIELLNTESFDVLQVEGLYMLQYLKTIQNYFSGKIVYRPHNIEHEIWKRNSDETKSLIKKIYFRILAHRLKNLEISFLNKYDYIIPISPKDSDYYTTLGNKKPSLTAPFGLDFKKIQPDKLNKNYRNIIFIGALDWIPNQKGLIWFIQNCWESVIKADHNIQLLIAGRNAPGWLKKIIQKKHRIQFLGEIENAHHFISNNGPLIVPLFAGSGIRVKIIEAMALKKCIISTSIGAEGIPYANGKNIIIADTCDDFIKAIIRVSNDQAYQDKMGENAFQLAVKHFDHEKIAKDVLNFIT
ncbi:MAG: glycosyltransferase family 4 protein [Bacteroidota bacterium]